MGVENFGVGGNVSTLLLLVFRRATGGWGGECLNVIVVNSGNCEAESKRLDPWVEGLFYGVEEIERLG